MPKKDKKEDTRNLPAMNGEELTLIQEIELRKTIRQEMYEILSVAKAANPSWNCPVLGIMDFMRKRGI